MKRIYALYAALWLLVCALVGQVVIKDADGQLPSQGCGSSQQEGE
jgi:hypothetical protein